MVAHSDIVPHASGVFRVCSRPRCYRSHDTAQRGPRQKDRGGDAGAHAAQGRPSAALLGDVDWRQGGWNGHVMWDKRSAVLHRVKPRSRRWRAYCSAVDCRALLYGRHIVPHRLQKCMLILMGGTGKGNVHAGRDDERYHMVVLQRVSDGTTSLLWWVSFCYSLSAIALFTEINGMSHHFLEAFVPDKHGVYRLCRAPHSCACLLIVCYS